MFRRYSDDRVLLGLEAEARAARRGLWSLPSAERIPPREWRDGESLRELLADGPDLSQLAFICRPVTPPYRPRRFDARFFLADAEAVLADDTPLGGDELLHTKWFSLEEAEALDLPSITRFVLKELRMRLAGEPVAPPFLRWSRGAHTMERLTLPVIR